MPQSNQSSLRESPERAVPPTVREALNQALYEVMKEDDRVLILGQDIIDPYGGAFKVTQGLFDAFGPERVRNTPAGELSILGIASGLALRGFRPIAEIMFGDFVLLGMDQIVNHISKWRYMFNEQVSVPLVIRTPMGGRRGYGPTHSQSLEAKLMGIPGVKVVAPCRYGSPTDLLKRVVYDDDPVIFIEYKTDYSRRLVSEYTPEHDFQISIENRPYPLIHLVPLTETPQIVIIVYGGMTDIGLEAARILLKDYGISAEILAYTQLCPLDISVPAQLIQTHGRAVVIEEGIREFGWGSEVVSCLIEAAFYYLEAPIKHVGSRCSPIGASKPLENAVLPQVEDVVKAVLETWE